MKQSSYFYHILFSIICLNTYGNHDQNEPITRTRRKLKILYSLLVEKNVTTNNLRVYQDTTLNNLTVNGNLNFNSCLTTSCIDTESVDTCVLNLPATTATCGQIVLATNPFMHAYGTSNTFLGTDAGNFTLTGNGNAGVGTETLLNLTSGNNNTSVGSISLQSDTTGSANTAIGTSALQNNTIGNSNTAVGVSSLQNSVAADNNTAIGTFSLFNNDTGTGNTAVGNNAALSLTTGSNNVIIGLNAGGSPNNYNASNSIIIGALESPGSVNGQIHIGVTSGTSCYIGGIHGVTTSNAAIPVLVDSANQLGTVSSSRRVKRNIQDMGDATENLYTLHPVTFNYITHENDNHLEYGLIAEEVEDIYPNIVVKNNEGLPETIQYQYLPIMLLNEWQKDHARIAQLEISNKELLQIVGQLITEVKKKVQPLAKL
ncbi:MAG: tail fiber domain-containing protein [Candidatus Babeliaceae bacterium]|jgi:hypothetical protein